MAQILVTPKAKELKALALENGQGLGIGGVLWSGRIV